MDERINSMIEESMREEASRWRATKLQALSQMLQSHQGWELAELRDRDHRTLLATVKTPGGIRSLQCEKEDSDPHSWGESIG
jgi:hypothetical protein